MLSKYEQDLLGVFKVSNYYKRSELLTLFSVVVGRSEKECEHVLNRTLLKLCTKGLIVKSDRGVYTLSSPTVIVDMNNILVSAVTSIDSLLSCSAEATLNAILSGDTVVGENYLYNKKVRNVVQKLSEGVGESVLDSMLDLLNSK